MLAIVILFQSASAENFFNSKVQVIKQGEDIYLTGTDCNILNKESLALEEWSKKLKENTLKNSCECANAICKKKVTAQLPQIVNTTQFEKPNASGPNCWNASLVAAKIIPQLRYSTPQEMSFWLKSPLCREKKSNEPLVPGDIIAILDKSSRQHHGFVYISENLSFSKNGFESDNPYSLQDPKKVFAKYQVKPKCERVDSKGACANHAKYYSCMSMEEYRSKNKSTDKKLHETIKAIGHIECELSKSLFEEGSFGVDNFISTNLEILNNLISEIYLDKKFKPEDAVLWEGLYYQIGAMLAQAEMKNTVGM
ncbi:hypothetical protein DOM21_11325 [Bacteriovorax stolpii]|nr:hypothetical protein DOM21_11325 [Bacteriovorax stolpii]